ncbi:MULTISPECIES: DUF2188 domain-containing protein [Cupriavidus]
MMQSKNVHIVPVGNAWAVELDGGTDRTVYPSQMAAIAAGWERAKRGQVDLLFHDRDGEIWARDTFDNDLPDVKRPAIARRKPQQLTPERDASVPLCGAMANRQ